MKNYLYLLCALFGQVSASHQSVEHKNHQLDMYLDHIRYNAHEKIGVLPYILKSSGGTFLEIGTGGDPVASMFERIPETSDVTVIASDVEKRVLEALPLRHPSLLPYMQASTGPKLRLKQLNAVDMAGIDDHSLDGINASALLHEIVSYAGGLDGCKKFFESSMRTLKEGGVLVYRDPEFVSAPNELVTIDLKTKAMKLFAHIFLFKFVDPRGSSLHKEGRKMYLYDPNTIAFTIYRKNEAAASHVSYGEYLDIPSYDIDFSRAYTVTLPKGLYRELERHYLTYLHQCNPLVYLKCTSDIYSGLYTVNHLAYNKSSGIGEFWTRKGWGALDEKITAIQKIEIAEEIEKNISDLEFGVLLHFEDRAKERALRHLLKSYNFNPEKYLIALNNGDYLMDYRIMGLLYDEMLQKIIDTSDVLLNPKSEEHAKWLQREGEEYYFYYTQDELIANAGKISIEQSASRGEAITMLCPASPDSSVFIDRLCYTELLNDSLEAYDTFGYPLKVKEGKRVIHFCKMAVGDALRIYKTMVERSPREFPAVKKLIEHIEENYMQIQDELLDIVDANDQVIGQKARSTVYANGLSNFRVVNAFLQNSTGELWIPRRTKYKRVFPLCLDASMGGHVTAGETYDQAFAREMLEELRIDVTKMSYKLLGKLDPHAHNTSAFMQVYLIHTDATPQFNEDDFEEYAWVKPEELLLQIAKGDRCKNDLPIIIREFFLHE